MTSERIDFQALYRRGVARVWRVVRRLGVAPSELEDAVQDVFIVAHRRLGTLRPEVAPEAWLTGIAVRVARDYRRRRVRKPSAEEPSPRLVSDASAPDELAERRDALEIALRLLDQLPDEQRAVFVLAEFEQHSAPEIAEMTSTGVNTVYSRLRLARARFDELVSQLESADE
ncbi:MAG: RNA polymerase sigma factor [Myxococcota bacterium]